MSGSTAAASSITNGMFMPAMTVSFSFAAPSATISLLTLLPSMSVQT